MTETPSSGCVEVNRVALHYRERGDGAPLVLIHGGLASSEQWAPVVPELADASRVITPDSRGHGRSTNPSERLSYGLIADDIAALIDALGLKHPIVGGWSDGGQVTLELGARHPGVAAALIAGAAYPDFDIGGLREAHAELLGVDDRGVPDERHLDAQLGGFAEEIKGLHPGGRRMRRGRSRRRPPPEPRRTDARARFGLREPDPRLRAPARPVTITTIKGSWA